MDSNHRAFRKGFTVPRNRPLCQLPIYLIIWRCVWDSNSRSSFELTFLAGRCIQPLYQRTMFYILHLQFGGWCEIRTHGAVTPAGFQDQCHRPLDQPSIYYHVTTSIWWREQDSNLRSLRDDFTDRWLWPLTNLSIYNLVGADGFEPPCLSEGIYSPSQSSTLPNTL